MQIPSHLPFAPRRVPVFYGWVVVGAATLGILFSIPGQTMGVSAFTESLLAATGLSRLGFSTAYLLGTLGSAALLPRAGVWVDQLGVRTSALLATTGLGVGVALFASVDRLAAGLLAATGGPPWVPAFAVLTALFLAVRFTGQGVLTLASRTMLARWFDRRRGLATAVSGLFVSFGFAAAPQLLDAWLQRSGWRQTYLELAAAEVLGMGLLAFLLYREDPESSGLTVDGHPPASPHSATPDEPSATRAEALRSKAFWVLTLALALHGMVVTGITLHVVDLGAEGGLDRAAAVSLFLPMAVVSTATGALVGWLADRVTIGRLLTSFLISAGVGYAASAHLGSPWGFAGAAGALGIAGGHFSVLTTVGLPRFFGRRHLGEISGASMTAVVVGSALGPSALAVSQAWAGSYAPGLYVAAALPGVLLVWGRGATPR